MNLKEKINIPLNWTKNQDLRVAISSITQIIPVSSSKVTMNQSIQAARWDDQRRRAIANSRNNHQHQDGRNKLVRINI